MWKSIFNPREFGQLVYVMLLGFIACVLFYYYLNEVFEGIATLYCVLVFMFAFRVMVTAERK